MSTTFGTVLRRLRKRRALTLQQVADRIGVSYPAVQQWETGKTKPAFDKLKPLSTALGANVRLLERLFEYSIQTGAASAEADLNYYIEEAIAEFDKEDRWKAEAIAGGHNPDWYVSFKNKQEFLLEQKERKLKDPSSGGFLRELVGVARTILPVDGGDFAIDGGMVDYVYRPFNLGYIRKCCAIVVPTSHMSPKFEVGDLIFVDFESKPKENDYILIAQEITENFHSIRIAKVVSLEAQSVFAFQFSPPNQIRVEITPDITIHPVVSWADLVKI